MKSDKRLEKLYAKYNTLYFDNKLPKNTQIVWKDLPEDNNSRDLGLTSVYEGEDDGEHFFVVSLNPVLSQVGWGQVKFTLLHEMAHVSVYPYHLHGRKWQEEMTRLALRGAFSDLW